MWLFICSDQTGYWQGGIRNTHHVSSQRNSISWWLLRAQLCTSKAVAVRSHSSALQSEDIHYPLVFPLNQETPCEQMLLISATLGREKWNSGWVSSQLFHKKVWGKAAVFLKGKHSIHLFFKQSQKQKNLIHCFYQLKKRTFSNSMSWPVVKKIRKKDGVIEKERREQCRRKRGKGGETRKTL